MSNFQSDSYYMDLVASLATDDFITSKELGGAYCDRNARRILCRLQAHGLLKLYAEPKRKAKIWQIVKEGV